MIMLPLDQPQRDQAVNPQGSFHLEAPAGSGKTTVLLERFLTLLAQADDPKELLVLTFTRKAAGELRARVMQLLWLKEEPPPAAPPVVYRLRELAQLVFRRHAEGIQWKLAPERLPIMTFHSFCAQLLRLAPQEAGVPLDFQLLAESDSQWLREEAVAELRRRLAARQPDDPVRLALVRRLARLNNNWPRLARELEKLLARRDCLQDFLQLAAVSGRPEAYARLLQERFGILLRGSLQNLQAALAATALGSAWPAFVADLKASGAPAGQGLPDRLPGAEARDLPAWQAVAQTLLTQAGQVRKSLTPQYGFPPDFKQTRWPNLIAQLPATVAALLHEVREMTSTLPMGDEINALQDLVILLGEALRCQGELCAQKAVLDFIALEQGALRLLAQENPSDLLLRWDYRLRHLLVDEFQDTSQNQLELLCRLLSGWQEDQGRTLLVVGDPKQSIYGWRQARLRLFLEARQGLPCGGGNHVPLTSLHLSTNFRSSRTLIQWVNQVFAQVLNDPTAPEKFVFHAAEPAPEAALGSPPHLALFTGEDKEAARVAEGRWLARQAGEILKKLNTAESIGVLLFTRRHLPTYLQAFQEASLSVKVREGLRLGDNRVVQHLHNLVRALVRPHDEVAWAALLRGPWASQDLHVLTCVAKTSKELWPEKLAQFAAASACPADLAKVAAALDSARKQVGHQPLEDIVHDWLLTTEAWPAFSAWEGPAGVANARAYLELLAQAESYSPEATYRKTDFLLSSAYQPPDPRAQDSPVEMLTVHGAKGLEFAHVFVPFLDWAPLQGEDQAPPFLLEEIPGSALAALALAKPYAAASQSSLYLALKKVRNHRILAEARRLFYVAVTRAQKSLYLSALLPQNRHGHRRPTPLSPIAWLWEVYQPQPPVPGVTAVWPEPPLRVNLFEDYPPAAPQVTAPPSLPPAVEFFPAEPPYRLQFPSQTGTAASSAQSPETLQEITTPEEEALLWAEAGPDAQLPRLRGEISHRLLDTLAQGRPLPPAAGVAAALRQEGVDPETAHDLAAEILAEVNACRQDPFLARLLSTNLPVAVSEWRLEDEAAPGLIRRGRIDRLVYDGQNWWLLDYKTGRPLPTQDWESFISVEKERYRPQLEAYREMAAKAFRLPSPEKIRLVLYFTASQRAVILA